MKKYFYILIGVLVTSGILLAGTSPDVTPVPDPYTDKGTTYEVAKAEPAPAAGEIKTTLSKTEPAVTFSKWNGEASFSIKYLGLSSTAQKTGDTVEWSDGTKQLQAFPLTAKEGMEDSGFETQLVLHSKPLSPVIEFALVGDENFTWNYQAPMNERGITEWHGVAVTCTETECSDVNGKVMTFTSADMAGGYTLMYGKQNHFVDKNGKSLGTNYQTGIFGNMSRPQFTDGLGRKTWGTQKYSLHKLQVTIPDSVYNDPQTDWSTFIIK